MKLDQLVMLLSTDWFEPYWDTIGIDTDSAAKASIKQGCRDIVEQILAGADNYYHISFSEARQNETKSLFESVIRESTAQESLLRVAETWRSLSDEEEKATWLYAVLTIELLSGQHDNLDTLPGRGIMLIMGVIEIKYELETFEFSEICEASQSTWDRFTRSLTPEQPTALADTLAGFLTVLRYQEFWFLLRERLTPTQRAELADWYRRMAKARAQRDLSLAYVN